MAAFKKGESGNPNGKPSGTANRLTIAMREQISAGANPIGLLQRVACGEAIEIGSGDDKQTVTPTLEQMIRAASKLVDKVLPDAKDGALKFDIGKITSPAEALEALGRVAQAVGEGQLTPSEASAVNAIINDFLTTYETTELERRLRDLEGQKK